MTSEGTPEVVQLARQILTHYGATIETQREDDRLLNVALGATLSAHFKREDITLAIDPKVEATAEIELVALGSRVVDQLSDWLRSRGETLWARHVAKHPAPKAFPKGVGPEQRVKGKPKAREGIAFDLELAARVSFISEGRDENLILISAPQDGPVEIIDASMVDASALEAFDPTQTLPSQRDVRERMVAAIDEAERWAQTDAAKREGALLEQLSREVHRLTNYYGELIAQSDDDDDALRAQFTIELDRRIAEEISTHQLAIDVDVVACAVLIRPMTVLRCEFADGSEERWRFDRVSGAWIDPGGVRYDS